MFAAESKVISETYHSTSSKIKHGEHRGPGFFSYDQSQQEHQEVRVFFFFFFLQDIAPTQYSDKKDLLEICIMFSLHRGKICTWETILNRLLKINAVNIIYFIWIWYQNREGNMMSYLVLINLRTIINLDQTLPLPIRL